MYLKFGEIPKIEIYYRKNGIFLFSGEASLGKTFACESLRKLSPMYPDVSIITVDSCKTEFIGNIEKAKVTFMDRADLYIQEGDVRKVLEKYWNNKVFIVDLKCFDYIIDVLKGKTWGFVAIELKENSIRMGM